MGGTKCNAFRDSIHAAVQPPLDCCNHLQLRGNGGIRAGLRTIPRKLGIIPAVQGRRSAARNGAGLTGGSKVFRHSPSLMALGLSGRELGSAGDAEDGRFAEVWAEDLQAGGEVFSTIEIGDAAGHGNAGDAGEVGGEGEDVR